MNKSDLLEQLIEAIEGELSQNEGAAREASEYATHEEAKATSKWDTQGLEASYLAQGQANHARELRDAIARLHTLKNQGTSATMHISEGSLVTLDINGEIGYYFLVPVGGGHELEYGGKVIDALTPQSPLGRLMMGKHTGGAVVFPNGSQARITDWS